ncbi:MAG: hypothetical protein JO025_11690 [Verrucomicrobia bacterium]|nr:hypothetical protein [Verrucomicrobiota bacterium]
MPLLTELVALYITRCYKDFAPPELGMGSAESNQNEIKFFNASSGGAKSL